MVLLLFKLPKGLLILAEAVGGVGGFSEGGVEGPVEGVEVGLLLPPLLLLTSLKDLDLVMPPGANRLRKPDTGFWFSLDFLPILGLSLRSGVRTGGLWAISSSSSSDKTGGVSLNSEGG